MKRKYLLMLIFGLAFSLKAQTEDPYQYYPMAVGNYWYYSQPLGKGYWLKVVHDSVDQIGNKYFFLQGTRYYRFCLDVKGYLWEDYYKLYKLNAALGERWWAIGDGIDTTSGMWGIVDKVFDTTYLGKQTKLKSYSFYGRRILYGRILDTYRFNTVLAYSIGMIYQDNDANPPYILEGAIINGEIIGNPVSVKGPDKELPSAFELYQNYPNPFNPNTVIKYQLKHSGYTLLFVYNLLGEKVAEVVNEYQNAGYYSYVLDFAKYNLPSGVYIYSIVHNNERKEKKMIYLK